MNVTGPRDESYCAKTMYGVKLYEGYDNMPIGDKYCVKLYARGA